MLVNSSGNPNYVITGTNRWDFTLRTLVVDAHNYRSMMYKWDNVTDPSIMDMNIWDFLDVLWSHRWRRDVSWHWHKHYLWSWEVCTSLMSTYTFVSIYHIRVDIHSSRDILNCPIRRHFICRHDIDFIYRCTFRTRRNRKNRDGERSRKSAGSTLHRVQL